MDNSYGILSLAPALIAVILAFITREALFSILCGVLVGLLITGQDLLFGFTGLIQSALGNADYIWVIGIEVFIGIMVAFFQKSGAIEAVANKLNEKLHITPRIAQIMGAALGKEYPVASARALSTMVKLGSRTHGLGTRQTSFRNWFSTVPQKAMVIR